MNPPPSETEGVKPLRYFLIVMLSLLSAAVVLFVFLIWTRWAIYICITEKASVAEVRILGFKKLLYSSANASDKTSSKHADKEKSGRQAFLDKLKSDKVRIYNENGFDAEEFKKVFSRYRDTYLMYKDVIFDFMAALRHKVEVPLLRINLDIGLDNPAHTGMAYASVWGAVGVVYPVLSRYMKIVYPTMSVTPDFYGKRFNFKAESIIKVRPAHIISALLKPAVRVGLTYHKNKKDV